MHFHLPKPLHGWREFAGEVGIIVIGVLIALSAEQIVETLHWRSQTRETEQALRTEIQRSVNSVAERQAIDGCLQSQLATLRSAVPRGLASQPLPHSSHQRVLPDVYETPWRAWTRGGWEAAIASNALNHVEPARLSAYADVYKAIEDVDGIERRERDAKGALAPLRLGPLQPEIAAQVITALTNLDRDRADILVAGGDLLKAAAVLDIQPQSPTIAIAADKLNADEIAGARRRWWHESLQAMRQKYGSCVDQHAIAKWEASLVSAR